VRNLQGSMRALMLSLRTSLTQHFFRNPALVAPLLVRWRAPPSWPPTPQVETCAAGFPSATTSHTQLATLDWLSGILLMAAPKKRTSYTRKRTRQAGIQRIRGPHLKSHMYMCPVCERMREPHKVCGREDCQTYFKHRWF